MHDGAVVWKCSEVSIQMGDAAPYSGTVHRKGQSTGVATHYMIRGSSGWSFPVLDVYWGKGEEVVRQIRADDVNDRKIPGCLARLGNGGLKLDVKEGPQSMLRLDLRQAKPKSGDQAWFTLQNATAYELKEGAGVDAVAVLSDMGARVGSRKDLLGDRSSHKNCLCAVFAESRKHIPVVAYTLTRVLPLLRLSSGQLAVE